MREAEDVRETDDERAKAIVALIIMREVENDHTYQREWTIVALIMLIS